MRFVFLLRQRECESYFIYVNVCEGLKHQPKRRLEVCLVLNEFLESVIMGLIAFAH